MAPDDPFVHAEMGAMYLQMGKWDSAKNYLRQVNSALMKARNS